LRKRQALVPEETSSAYRCIRRPRLGAEMGSGSLPTRPSPSALSPPWPIPGRARPPRLCSLGTGKLRAFSIKASHSGLSEVSVQSLPDTEVTGAAYSFTGATTSLTNKILTSSKKITLVRHGLSSWNAESRVQGSSNLSVLTETGAKQAEKCRDALANMKFDVCFSSPISRAKSTAEIIWQGKEEPLVFLNSLKEAHLFFLEGMTNGSGC